MQKSKLNSDRRNRLMQKLFAPRAAIFSIVLAICGWLVPGHALAVGTWIPLANTPPAYISLMLQLSDGTVMCQGFQDTNWFLLTPDNNGSYVNGTWTTLAAMSDSRLYFSSQVLRDGRVLVAGGEYGSVTNTLSAEYYQPTNNTWTLTQPSPVVFSDSASEMLPNGDVIVAPVEGGGGLDTIIYSAVSNSWSFGPQLLVAQNEASWVKLPDDSILTIDNFTTTTERYIPSLNQWIADSTAPVNLYNAKGELGAAFLLPNGKVFFIGATNQTLIYTPTGNTNAGTWTLGPRIPNNLGANDAPAAMMANGKILCALGDDVNQVAPTYFYEYDYVANAFTLVASPTGGTNYNQPTYPETMLDLPDGTVLFAGFSPQPYIYQPDGSPLTAGKPVIKSVTANGDGSYHVTGTLFDGISEGAAFGDDWQMSTCRPLAHITNSAGNVLYCRTYNWSSTGVMTGTNILTTEMTLPAGTTNGTYPLFITANGNTSDAFYFTMGNVVSVTPPKIIVVANKTSLNLSWPTDHIGWRLLMQTNNLAKGVSSNTNDWGTVSGSSVTNLVSVPIVPANPTEFFRLVYP
jgi:galactose oxidase-like protein